MAVTKLWVLIGLVILLAISLKHYLHSTQPIVIVISKVQVSFLCLITYTYLVLHKRYIEVMNHSNLPIHHPYNNPYILYLISSNCWEYKYISLEGLSSQWSIIPAILRLPFLACYIHCYVSPTKAV